MHLELRIKLRSQWITDNIVHNHFFNSYARSIIIISLILTLCPEVTAHMRQRFYFLYNYTTKIVCNFLLLGGYNRNFFYIFISSKKYKNLHNITSKKILDYIYVNGGPYFF